MKEQRVELSQDMKDALLVAMQDDSLDFEDTIISAIRIFVSKTCEPLYVPDEDYFQVFCETCLKFIVDSLLANLILSGRVEVSGIEDGDFTYALTKADHGTL